MTHPGFRQHLAAKGTPPDEIEILCAELDRALATPAARLEIERIRAEKHVTLAQGVE